MDPSRHSGLPASMRSRTGTARVGGTTSDTILTRAAGTLSSFDAKARTVDLVLASEHPVRRRSWQGGEFDEILTVSPEAIDTSRLNSMPLLDSHNAHGGLDARLGSILPSSLRFEGSTAIVTAKLSRNAKGEALHRDLEDGHTVGISVGYKIESQERTEAKANGTAIVRATRWQPMEISAVAIPADPNASTRAHNPDKDPKMPENTETITREERKRATDITEVARTARIDDDAFIRQHIENGTTLEDFRSAVFDKLVERQEKAPTFPHVPTRGTGDDRAEDMRSAMVSALVYRVDSSHKPTDGAREFVGLSIPELARRGLELHGISTSGMSASQVIQRALHTTSDFSQVISDVGRVTLQAAYSAVPSALKAVGHQTAIRDFKRKHAVRLSGFSDLEKVNEHGEFTHGTFSEGGESYRLETWGRIFGMSRQMLVNDELGAFATVSRELGNAARRREADILASLVMANPVMDDGKAVFHADHKNLGTAAALSETSLSAARLAMSKQTGLAGELIDVTPKFLVVGLDLQTTAEKLLTAIQAATTEDVNIFVNRLQLVVDRRLTNPTAWYLVAAPSEVPGLEYAYLEGEEGPQFFTKEGFEVDGVQIKVRLDFGAGWLDHRGWYRNPGA